MTKPRVSIGIPAFKGRFFHEALLCWKRQTFADFEVIVQDDCSPDDMRGIFEATVGDDPRFAYARNECSTAPNFVDNWMKTLDKARGELFVLGSDDDLYEPDYLEKMVALAERYPRLDIFDARHDFIGEQGVVRTCTYDKEVESQIEWLHAVVCGKRYAIAQSVMCRTQALRAIGGFVNLPAAWGGCDWLTWASLAKKGIANSSDVLMHWRADGGNTTSSADSYWTEQKLKALKASRALWRKRVDELRPKNVDEKRLLQDIRSRAIENYFTWMCLWIVLQLPLRRSLFELYRAYCRGDMSWLRYLTNLTKRTLGIQ